MKKKLKLLSMMLVFSLIPTGIFAQSWTASAPENGGSYYLYNVGEQKFLCGANSWGTFITASPHNGISVTLEQTGDNLYKINTSPTYSNKYMGNDLYVDKASDDQYVTNPWEIVLASGSTDTYTIKETRKNRYLMINSSSKQGEWSTSVPTSDRGKWQLITRQDYINYIAANASADNPLDATMLITNANFGRNASTSPWQGSPAIGGINENMCAERWNMTFNVNQTLTGIPNGVYIMQIQGFYRMGGGANDAVYAGQQRAAGTEALNAIYFANEQEHAMMSIFDDETHLLSNNGTYNTSTAVNINGTNYYVPSNMNRASSCFNAGDYENEPLRVVVTDGTLTLGVKKTVSSSNDWTIFDNIRLTYYGIDIDELKTAAIAKWNAYKEITDQALDHSEFDAVLAGADSYVTSEATIDEYDAIVWNALCDLLKTQTTATGQFDITSLIKNPQFESSAADWTTDGTIGYEAKYGIAEFYGQGDVTLSQTLANMPAGNYTLKAQSFFRSRGNDNANRQYEQGTDEVTASLFFGDDTQPVHNIFDQARYAPAYPAGNWGGAFQRSTPNTLHAADEAFKIGQYWNVLRSTTTDDGDINLGISISGGSTSCWVPFDNFKLYYGTTDIPVTLTSAEGLTLTDDTYADVTSDITLTAGQYNQVCLPFDLDETQTAATFSNVYTLIGVDEGEGVGQLLPATSIKAGQAYFVTVDATKQLSIDDVRICVAKPDSVPVMWEGAATVGNFEGFTFAVNPSDGVTISSYAPINYMNQSFTVNQENWRVRRFLSEVTYTDDMASKITYFDAGHPMRLDQPHSVFIPVPQNNSELTATISKNSDYSEPETFTFAAGTTLCEVPNLIPQNTYYFKVEAGGSVVAQGQFNTEGHVRMIKASSCFNIRDLGGRETIDGLRVRYGKVFRGGELNYGHMLSDADKAELLRLGVGAEIDWRRDDETNNENPTTSILGDDVPYLYMNMDYADLGYAYDVNQQKFKQAFEFTLNNLREGKAVYFHCRIGADRTGAFAMLLDGLCGMTFDQIVKDYELTSYSEAGTRPWDDAGSTNNMIKKYEYINSLPGNNLHQKFFYYANTVLGIPAEDIIEFIDIMVGECSITHSDLAFMLEDGIYIQDADLVKAICQDGSTVKDGAKAILTIGSQTSEIDMSIDHIQISFSDINLYPGCDYTVTIPAGSIENGGVENAAEAVVTFHVPMVFDGDYYLYCEEHKQFMSRGRNYGTRSVLDNFGIPATFTTDLNNVTTIKFLDNNLYLGESENNGVYADVPDNAPTTKFVKWNLLPALGGFILHLIEPETTNPETGEPEIINRYLTMALDETYGCYFGRSRTTEEADPTVFNVMDILNHKINLSNKKEANILSAASVAGIEASNIYEFEAALNNYTTVPANVISSATSGSTTNWALVEDEFARNEGGHAYNVGNYGGELYLKNASVTQTVTVPHSGLYKLTLNGFFRQGSNERCYAAGQKGFSMSNAYVSVNDIYYAQMPDWYSDCTSSTTPNNVDEAKALMDAGKYSVEVYAYIDDSKTATIKLTVPGFTPSHWCIFNNWALTEYVPSITISETDEAPAVARDLANVTLQRTLKPDILNTFSVPFNLSAAQIATSPLKRATIYKYGSSTEDVIYYETTTSIEAGKPYVVKLPEGSSDIINPTFNNVKVVSTQGEIVGDEGAIRFVGQPYWNKGITENYPYVFYITTSGESKRLSQTGNIKGLRAYYLLPSTSEGVKAYFNDIASSVDELPLDGIESAKTIYDLSGRKIEQDQPLMPGIYIVNGKKVLVK